MRPIMHGPFFVPSIRSADGVNRRAMPDEKQTSIHSDDPSLSFALWACARCLPASRLLIRLFLQIIIV